MSEFLLLGDQPIQWHMLRSRLEFVFSVLFPKSALKIRGCLQWVLFIYTAYLCINNQLKLLIPASRTVQDRHFPYWSPPTASSTAVFILRNPTRARQFPTIAGVAVKTSCIFTAIFVFYPPYLYTVYLFKFTCVPNWKAETPVTRPYWDVFVFVARIAVTSPPLPYRTARMTLFVSVIILFHVCVRNIWNSISQTTLQKKANMKRATFIMPHNVTSCHNKR